MLIRRLSGELAFSPKSFIMDQLATFQLHQLRCITERDTQGGSEPYLWVTYFHVDSRSLSRPEPVITYTPQFTRFRQEFPDNVADGQMIAIPPTLARFSAIIDPEDGIFAMAGCIVILLEEDETPEKAIEAGQRAYAAEIHRQLNELIKKRIVTFDKSPVRQEEMKVIRDSVKSKVKSAVKSELTLRQKLFGNQDDFLAFTHVTFTGKEELVSKDFDFPELFNGETPEKSSNRFVLTGSLTVGEVPPPPPADPCARQREALQKKREEIRGFHLMVQSLQKQLQTAGPAQKAGIVKQIKATNEKIALLEAELPGLEAALKGCEKNPLSGTHVDPGGGILVGGG